MTSENRRPWYEPRLIVPKRGLFSLPLATNAATLAKRNANLAYQVAPLVP
jgi:hypothetical protein